MYHINNNVFFSCDLKVVRLQSDIRNAVGRLFHTEGLETAMSSVATIKYKTEKAKRENYEL